MWTTAQRAEEALHMTEFRPQPRSSATVATLARGLPEPSPFTGLGLKLAEAACWGALIGAVVGVASILV